MTNQLASAETVTVEVFLLFKVHQSWEGRSLELLFPAYGSIDDAIQAVPPEVRNDPDLYRDPAQYPPTDPHEVFNFTKYVGMRSTMSVPIDTP